MTVKGEKSDENEENNPLEDEMGSEQRVRPKHPSQTTVNMLTAGEEAHRRNPDSTAMKYDGRSRSNGTHLQILRCAQGISVWLTAGTVARQPPRRDSRVHGHILARRPRIFAGLRGPSNSRKRHHYAEPNGPQRTRTGLWRPHGGAMRWPTEASAQAVRKGASRPGGRLSSSSRTRRIKSCTSRLDPAALQSRIWDRGLIVLSSCARPARPCRGTSSRRPSYTQAPRAFQWPQ